MPVSNDPERQVGCDLVGREQAILTGCQCGIVQLTIPFTEITPVAAKMTTQVHAGVELALLDQFVNASRQDQLAWREAHVGNYANEECFRERKSAVAGKSVSVRVDHGGGSIIKKQ